MLIVISLFENNIYDIFHLKESTKNPDYPYVLGSIYDNGLGVDDNYPVGKIVLARIRKGAKFVPLDIEQNLFFI